MAELLARVEAAGYRAIVVTADATVNGLRNREQRAGFMWPPEVRAVNLPGGGLPQPESPAPAEPVRCSPASFAKRRRGRRCSASPPSPAQIAGAAQGRDVARRTPGGPWPRAWLASSSPTMAVACSTRCRPSVDALPRVVAAVERPRPGTARWRNPARHRRPESNRAWRTRRTRGPAVRPRAGSGRRQRCRPCARVAARRVGSGDDAHRVQHADAITKDVIGTHRR